MSLLDLANAAADLFLVVEAVRCAARAWKDRTWWALPIMGVVVLIGVYFCAFHSGLAAGLIERPPATASPSAWSAPTLYGRLIAGSRWLWSPLVIAFASLLQTLLSIDTITRAEQKAADARLAVTVAEAMAVLDAEGGDR